MNPEPLRITILKPIHGTYCSIDFRKLQEAVKNHQMIELTLNGVGTCTVDPRWWFETAAKKEKRVMKYKDNPMTLVYNFAPIKNYALKNKDVSVGQESLF